MEYDYIIYQYQNIYFGLINLNIIYNLNHTNILCQFYHADEYHENNWGVKVFFLLKKG